MDIKVDKKLAVYIGVLIIGAILSSVVGYYTRKQLKKWDNNEKGS